MLHSFVLSFRLRNAYRVNSILYSLKQIPLVKKILPDRLYQSKALKILGNIISILLEIVNIFLGKILYLWLMIYAFLTLYPTNPANTFLHLIFFLTIAGALMNTYMFNPTKDKYYAMILMRMDARWYTVSNYLYSMLKTIIGFLPFTLLFGFLIGMPLWISILLPFFIAFTKSIVSCYNLAVYQNKKQVINENNPPKSYWIVVGICLLCAYGLPALHITITPLVFGILFLFFALCGIYAWVKIWNFPYYFSIYRFLLANHSIILSASEQKNKVTQETTHKYIQFDARFTSNKKGFTFFHDLFVKRHRKILTLAIKKQSIVILLLFLGALVLLLINKDIHGEINGLLLTYLPYFVFIMYLLNRGTTVTQAMFMNCDHSMLTYRIYRTPRVILGIFRERLKTLISLNLIPAFILGSALTILLYVTGGTDNLFNYLVLFVSIPAMSVFFSVHYLVMYYLLQPYNVQTEMKSSTYSLVQGLTYFVCYFMIDLHLPTFYFGIATCIFCILYSLISLFLVYHLAPKTFKLRL